MEKVLDGTTIRALLREVLKRKGKGGGTAIVSVAQSPDSTDLGQKLNIRGMGQLVKDIRSK